MRQNSEYYNYAKGICIICVIMIHALFLSATPNFNLSQAAAIVIRQIINFPVAVFLGFAGFFVGVSAARGECLNIWKRIIRLLVPYVIATIIFLAASRAYLDIFNPYYLFKVFFLGTGIGIGYFVVVMVQMTILTPFILSLKGDKQHYIVMIIVSLFGFAYTYAANFLDLRSLYAFPLSTIFFFVWYPFYHLGVFLGVHPEKVDAMARSPILLPLAAFALVLSLGEAFLLRGILEFSLFGSQLKLTSLLYALVIFALFLTRRMPVFDPLVPLVASIGTSSYFIYLYHLLILRRVLGYVSLVIPVGLLAQILASFIVLGMLVVFINVSKRLIDGELLKKYLGIGDVVRF